MELTKELEESLKGIYEQLTDEQKEKAKQCKTMDELMTFAGEEGLELPDEIVSAVAGGGNWGRCLHTSSCAFF